MKSITFVLAALLLFATVSRAQIPQTETFVMKIHKGNVQNIVEQTSGTKILPLVHDNLYSELDAVFYDVEVDIPNPTFTIDSAGIVKFKLNDIALAGSYAIENWFDPRIQISFDIDVRGTFKVNSTKQLAIDYVDADISDIHIDLNGLYDYLFGFIDWILDTGDFTQHIINAYLDYFVEPKLKNMVLCSTTFSNYFPGTTSLLTVSAGALTFSDPYFCIPVNVQFPGDPVQKRVSEIPTEFSLNQNAPNPFNPTTQIQFALPQDEHVRLGIYNALGQEVVTLIDEQRSAGYHNVSWNGRDKGGRAVSTGLYIYRIQAGEFVTSRKMTLMK